jgi:hypothetical protein
MFMYRADTANEIKRAESGKRTRPTSTQRATREVVNA